MRVCSVAGCGEKHDAKGYCHVHYKTWKRRGDPLAHRLIAKKGSGWLSQKGYRVIMNGGKKKFAHVRAAEKALGKPLPPGAVVHHADEDVSNNTNSNLVICPDVKYHKLLHTRINAMAACGNQNWRKCPYCGQHDDPLKMRAEKSGRYVHRECSAKARQVAYAKRRANVDHV